MPTVSVAVGDIKNDQSPESGGGGGANRLAPQPLFIRKGLRRKTALTPSPSAPPRFLF